MLDNTKSKKYIIEQQHQRWINFFKSLINYRLDLWEARNTHLHGTTPQNQRYIRRKKAIQIATDLYNQGKISVPHNQERLFHNFNQRIEGRTQSIQFWIELVRIAQKKRKQEIKEANAQKHLTEYGFSTSSTST